MYGAAGLMLSDFEKAPEDRALDRLGISVDMKVYLGQRFERLFSKLKLMTQSLFLKQQSLLL